MSIKREFIQKFGNITNLNKFTPNIPPLIISQCGMGKKK